MKLIKFTFLSCALISSCSVYPSQKNDCTRLEYRALREEMCAPSLAVLNGNSANSSSSSTMPTNLTPAMNTTTQALLNNMAASSSSSSASGVAIEAYSGVSPKAQKHVDKLEVQEIPLVSQKYAQEELERATIAFQAQAQKSESEFVKEMHVRECAKLDFWVSHHHALQQLASSKLQGASQETLKPLHDKIGMIETLNAKNNEDCQILLNQAHKDKSKLRRAFSFIYDKNNLYRAQALVAHTNHQKALQKNKELQDQIVQLLAHNQSLQAAVQQEPGAQQIEGMPNQPGGI